ncbi:hypothetical protein N9C70_05665, partial [Flavobacteriales bacterium]|nr:hypothetical protein [Flavobacteriales bacterium]
PGVCGCGTPDTDSDSDGTPDCNDNCPNDINKTELGTCGCGTPDTDSDLDGTPDCNDACPNDINKIAEGDCGCGNEETDTDSDGTPDCIDNCPNDVNKTEPGTCGCGVDDNTDTDSDGTPDCNDNCPNDVNKTEPGTCGCGTPDTDTDSDGTPDCNDNCPNDINKTEPGTCGCGTVDADVDEDGLCDNDNSDNCFDTAACNYADVGNAVCITPTGCQTCANNDGTGSTNANDDDADGTCNIDDGCPNDAAKIAPGTCGCGNVDVDVDNDGLCDEDGSDDCFDTSACNYADADNAACNTPTGCETCTNNDGTGGTNANDDDSDGTCNIDDGCPDDPAKIAPGICGCGNVDTDIDNDGVCDDNDLCTDPLANNYQSAGGEECAPCPDAPVFDGIDIESFATTMSSTDGNIALDISSGNADTLFLFGQNGAGNLTIELPSDLDNIPAGYYTAMVMDSDGCIGVAQLSAGGTTLQQPGITRPLIVPYALCCSGCGVNDTDSDGICDDDDNCTDQTACNFADECNEACVYPDGNGDCTGFGTCGSLRLITPQGNVADFDPSTGTFSDPGVSIPNGVTEFIEYNGGYLLSYGGGGGGGIQPTDSDMNITGSINIPDPWVLYNGIASMNGTLITVVHAGELASIDPTTGNWSNIGFTVDGMKGGVEYNAGADLVYAITSGGEPSSLLHIDPATGSVTSSTPVSPATVLGSLRYSGGVLYAGGQNGGLYTLNSATGVLTSIGTMPAGQMISGIANKQN